MVFGPLNEVKHVSLPAGRGKLGEVFKGSGTYN